MSTTQPPALSTVHVQGFQSLHNVTLDLAPLTVIVGPSSSGKSAFVRALRTLHHNARGTSFITQGFKRCQIEATLSDSTTVTLTRSTSLKDNHYAYVLPDAEPEVFTKLAGEVPDEIKNLLPSIPDLTFASQFDKPYLLDASPTEVARTLAALTNVHVILSAAREANRRRLAASATLRTRQEDHTRATAALQEYQGLPDALRAQERAETSLHAVNVLASQIDDLSKMILRAQKATDEHNRTTSLLASTPVPPDISDLETQVSRAARLRALTREGLLAAKALESIDVPTAALPGLEPLSTLHARSTRLRALLVSYRDAQASSGAAQGRITEAQHEMSQALDAYADALAAAGVCPTCGQGTDHAHDSSKEMLG